MEKGITARIHNEDHHTGGKTYSFVLLPPRMHFGTGVAEIYPS